MIPNGCEFRRPGPAATVLVGCRGAAHHITENDMGRFRNHAACAIAALGLLLAACDDSSSVLPQDTAADQAYTFTIPIYKFFATQRAYIAQGFVPNYLVHSRALATSALRTVTKPNHDTLYSIAWIKLDNGPIEIDTPESGSRYFSLALMDAYTNNFAVRGTRVDGGHAKRLWLAGPGWTGEVPDGTELVLSETDSVWALARTYVDGTPEDYTAAWAVQDQLKIVQPSTTPPTTAFSATDLLAPPADTDTPNYFAYVDQLMTQDPPPRTADAFIHNGPGTIGVGPGLAYDPAVVDATLVATGATAARTRALASTDRVDVNGWAYATDDIGSYGTNYDLRAHLALTGLAALPRAEAIYDIANAALATPGVPLAGDTVYTLTFPAGALPPTGAFWSLTLYEGQNPAQEFFYVNPDNIWAISWPASNPAFNPDGSMTLTIANVQPAGVPLSNWLPAPVGTYSLQFRNYLPTADVLERVYELPPVVAAP
jgi:hypothetical protein